MYLTLEELFTEPDIEALVILGLQLTALWPNGIHFTDLCKYLKGFGCSLNCFHQDLNFETLQFLLLDTCDYRITNITNCL